MPRHAVSWCAPSLTPNPNQFVARDCVCGPCNGQFGALFDLRSAILVPSVRTLRVIVLPVLSYPIPSCLALSCLVCPVLSCLTVRRAAPHPIGEETQSPAYLAAACIPTRELSRTAGCGVGFH